jgi:hypothetical protein
MAKSALRPSKRNASERFSAGAHVPVTVNGPVWLTDQNAYVK